MRKIVLIVLSFVVGLSMVAPSSVAAQVVAEQPMESIEVTSIEITALTEEEKQEILAEIAVKLKEAEREAMRLSLLVAKFALEEQAIALQQRLTAQTESSASAPVLPEGVKQDEPIPTEVVVNDKEPEDFAAVRTDEEVSREEQLREETVFSGIALEDEGPADSEGDQEERNFLAALGPLGNLGTPQLAVLGILAALALFVVIRRLRERRNKEGSSKQTVPVQASQQYQQRVQHTPQNAFQEGRQELKERVAWK